jgi:hypothetical protein
VAVNPSPAVPVEVLSHDDTTATTIQKPIRVPLEEFLNRFA